MGRNYTTYYCCILLLSIMLLPAVGGAEQPAIPPPAPGEQPLPLTQQQPPAAPEQAAVPSQRSPVVAEPTPAPSESNGRLPAGTDAAGAATYPNPNPNSSWSSQSMATATMPSVLSPWSGSPLAYSASRSGAALRIDDLMRGAAALRAQGNFSKAMALYNEALTIAPQYAEGYRQRALTVLRLGDRVQAQVDYNHFLALDPQAAAQVREEVVLFEQSGRAPLGEAEAASYSYGPPLAAGPFAPPLAVDLSSQRFAETRFSAAQDAFQSGDYDSALLWAANSNHDMPQARTRALMAQILFAQGDFRGAAAEARAAVAMGPVLDWRTLYSYYGYAMPRFSRQLDALEEFVRQNPSSADGHFLLGYEQLVLGHAESAHAQLAIASVIEPSDVVATGLLAKDGVEIVSSRRPLVQAAPPSTSAEVARRPPTPPIGVGPWSSPRSGVSASEGTTPSEVTR
ncbi:MAG: tetratricopeptide repeat protein [Thermoguttaceae bacterium]|jgi:tetratricopeptide (TPR) repeat protein